MSAALSRIRLVHPFPSLVDGIATAAIAMVAAGDIPVAVRLGASMTCLQFAIGGLNDLVDAAHDVGRPEKPIAAGLVTRRAAGFVVVAALVAGLALAALSGPPTLLVALAGTAVGVAYDRWLQRTPWAWLAFALGLPLLPVFAWLGAVGALPPAFAIVVPVASLAGAAVSLANGLVDPAGDATGGARTPAVALGPARAWRVLVVLLGAVALAGLGTLVWLGGAGPGGVLALAGALALAPGAALLHGPTSDRRELGWELVAVGLGALGAGWVWAVAQAGILVG